MESMSLDAFESVRGIVEEAQRLDVPLVVRDGEDECLVVMRPAVFERVLFGDAATGLESGRALHY